MHSRRGTALRATLAVALLLTVGPVLAQSDAQKRWEAGAYSFSDELGGFRITAVRGTGMLDDPVVITQELTSSSPVTLVIRAIKPIRQFESGPGSVNGQLRLRLETLNNSGQAWVEFEFELQELLHKPSLYGDGLSFDQLREDARRIISDSFTYFSRNFEPYDRLRFGEGRIDPKKSGSFEFMITDFTPKLTFYLVQDPRIPLS